MIIEKKMVIISIIMSIIIFLIDVIVGSLFLYKGNTTFLDQLLFKTNFPEIFTRILTIAIMVSFSVVIFKILAKSNKFEHKIKEKENKYRTIIQIAMDGFWITDLDGRFLEVMMLTANYLATAGMSCWGCQYRMLRQWKALKE